MEVNQDIIGEDLINQVIAKFPVLKDRKDQFYLAMNEEHIRKNDVILPNSTIAIFPPVTGG